MRSFQRASGEEGRAELAVEAAENVHYSIVSAFASPADPGSRAPDLGDGALMDASWLLEPLEHLGI